jgi:UV DNA damage endonuclease
VKLGFAVKVIGRSGLRSHDTRRWQSNPSLGESILYLHAIFDYLDQIDVRMYRMASAIAPYASHPGLKAFRDQPQRFAEDLAKLGDRARHLDLRLSTHPGQYTVLNSTTPATVDAALAEIEVHAEILEAMGLGPECVVVLHVGGISGDRQAAKSRFVRGFERLSGRAQQRLAIENDDRSFGLADTLQISRLTGCPVVWDVLHHHCFDPDAIPDDEALRLAVATWPQGVTPKMHFSSPVTSLQVRKVKEGRRTIEVPTPPQLRAHADMIDPVAFSWFLDHVKKDVEVDVMLEAKAKEVALITLRRQLDRLTATDSERS